MKIAIVGESPVNPSGFGQQVRMLAEGFQQRGHKVVCVSLAYSEETLPDIEEWRLPNIRDLSKVDEALSLISPDAVICFWHTSGVQDFTSLKYPPGNAVSFYWLPWEGSTLPKGSEDYFNRVEKGRIVHLSNYAHELWLDHLDTNEVIPHGVDTQYFNIDPHKNLRRDLALEKWETKLNVPLHPMDILLLNVDRNIWHKRWDAAFDFVRKLQLKTERRIKLIAHTRRVEKSATPIDGYNLPELEKEYGLKPGTVIYTDFDWMRGLSRHDMAELYRLADMRISMSEGEGFGIPTIEASMCGCLQLVNNTTTMPELFPEESPCLAWPAMSESKRGVLYQVPNVNAMVERANRLLFRTDATKRGKIIFDNYKHVQSKFSSDVVVSQWIHLIEKTMESVGDSSERWYSLRDGYGTNYHDERDHHYLAQIISKFGGNAKVLQLGSFTGKFVESCASNGIFVRGIEPDATAHAKCGTKAQLLTQHASLLDDWPESDIIVATDFLTLYDKKEVESILKLATTRGKWILLRNHPIYKKGSFTYDLSWAERFLESLGASRRYDLEKIARARWFKEFSHEIWQTQESWEDTLIPAGFE